MFQVISLHDKGPAVEDMQRRLAAIGLLDTEEADGEYGEETAVALRAFCRQAGLPVSNDVDEKLWAALVDASFEMGDRSLYLRMPYFHGHDVRQLQQALGSLGFDCGGVDGIFGAYTELALRKFQTSMALPSDGIAGAYTFSEIFNLHHSWEDKETVPRSIFFGFARAADVLEDHSLCLFGTCDFTRNVAARMSNLALATNPTSKVLSADMLLVKPDEKMLLVHILLKDGSDSGISANEIKDTTVVSFGEGGAFNLRLFAAISRAIESGSMRIAIELPSRIWETAGEERSSQHYAIELLDALCNCLTEIDVMK